MILIISVITFLLFYLACFDFTNSEKKSWLIIGFIFCSFLLRMVINPVLNSDFYLYYNFKIFQKPTGFLSYLIREPYLYAVYSFFNFFSNDKRVVFFCLYWFNHIITTVFFVWLIKLKDIEVWKKMLIFSIFYFFFGFVFLRNGPAYLLFAVYFYYSYRKLKFNYILITPFMHISSILMLAVYFHKWKKYYLYFLVFCILGSVFFLVLKPYLQSIDAFNYLLFKINEYSKINVVIGYMHWLFFIFISVLWVLGIRLYRKRMLHPFLVTTAFFYYVSYFINPIIAFRFTPYVLFALLFLNFDTLTKQINRMLNLLSIFLLVIYLFALSYTHHQLFFI